MSAEPDGLLSQWSDIALGVLAAGLGARLLGRASYWFGAFFALLGPALILAALNHRHVKRRGGPSLPAWGASLLLLSSSLLALALGHAALPGWTPPVRAVAAAVVCLVLPLAANLLIHRSKIGTSTWNHLGWTQIQLQAVCVTALCALVIARPALAGRRGALLELAAAVLAVAGLFLQQRLKRRRVAGLGPIDRNTLFHLFLGAALLTFYAALSKLS
jgi:hypothetical protein